MLKSYLSIQPFSFSGFMISKTYIVAQKPCWRQLNTKVYGGWSAKFLLIKILFNNGNSQMVSTHLHSSMKVIYTLVHRSTISQRLHNFQQPKSELFTVQCSCYPLRRTPFSNYVRMRTGSLIPRPQITAFWHRTRLVCVIMSMCVNDMSSHSLPRPRPEDDTQPYWQYVGEMMLTIIFCML